MFDLEHLINLVHEAGKAILEIYATDFTTTKKADHSPLTLADETAHKLILSSLQKEYPDIPVLSEEGSSIPYEQRSTWNYFWLVDPLDGTKEFVNRNGEFTVNIALIRQGQPLFGIVHAPVLQKTYYGVSGEGAYMSAQGKSATRISVNPTTNDGVIVVQSRSHPSPDMDAFLSAFHVSESISKGSSLKFCLVAEGKAHLYPRLGPMMEWDCAAGHCIVEAAGGFVQSRDGKKLRYNSASLRFESVIASSFPLQTHS